LGLGLNSQTDYRLRESHCLKGYRFFLQAKGIACSNIFKTNCCTDIASLAELNWVLFVGMHLVNTANTLLFTGTGVENVATAINLSGVNPDEGQTAYKGVGSNLEC